MEVQDGFIVGIFNYCDRWCERCPLTNRCRVFAALAEMDFEEGNGPLTEPRIIRERRRWEERMIEMHAKAEQLGAAALSKPAERVGQLPPDLEASATPDPVVVANDAALCTKMQRLRMSANPTVQRNLHRALPNARSFVRPGFDEPDEVKMVEAAEC